MLGKLMKYEFKATGRVFLPLFAALIVLSAVNRVLTALNFGVVKDISTAVSIMLMAGIFVIAFVITLQRFINNLLKDEGYLMFTLPVRTDSLILSKLFVSAVWFIASFLVVMASIVIMTGTGTILPDFWDALRRIANALGSNGLRIALTVIELLAALIVNLFAGILTLYASMSLSLLANRRRGLFGFGAFIVICIALQVISAVVIAVTSATGAGNAFDNLSVYALQSLAVLADIVITAAVAAGLYFLSRYLLRRRLNLE